MERHGSRDTPEARHDANVTAARAVVKISGKLGLPVEPEIARLAEQKQFREQRYEQLAAAQAAQTAQAAQAAQRARATGTGEDGPDAAVDGAG